MNFVFFSVHFPDHNREFSHNLNLFGARVLGIGDTDYERLDERLKNSLTEYYKVQDLENYREVFKAVAYFSHKYGKIDRFESLNEHWLELEARIRTDFNIEGVKVDQVDNIKRKTRMKRFFEQGGASVIPYADNLTTRKIRNFARNWGYPVIIKPDKGSGANLTYKISNDDDLENFLRDSPRDIEFITEKFIEGTIVTYDGLIDRKKNILFASSTVYGQSVMEVVNKNDHVHYITLPEVPDDIRRAGSAIIKAFGLGEKFFHLELIRVHDAGELIPLEINMRPPGAWMTDSINYTHDMDIYREWANMIVNGWIDGPFKGKYYTSYASRKDHKSYAYDHGAILNELNGKIVKHAPIEPVFSRGMGNYAYQFRSESESEIGEMIRLIQEEESE